KTTKSGYRACALHTTALESHQRNEVLRTETYEKGNDDERSEHAGPGRGDGGGEQRGDRGAGEDVRDAGRGGGEQARRGAEELEGVRGEQGRRDGGVHAGQGLRPLPRGAGAAGRLHGEPRQQRAGDEGGGRRQARGVQRRRVGGARAEPQEGQEV